MKDNNSSSRVHTLFPALGETYRLRHTCGTHTFVVKVLYADAVCARVQGGEETFLVNIDDYIWG